MSLVISRREKLLRKREFKKHKCSKCGEDIITIQKRKDAICEKCKQYKNKREKESGIWNIRLIMRKEIE
jgi:ribosomal protein L37AE/L43A